MLNSRVYYGMFLTEHYLDSTTLSVALHIECKHPTATPAESDLDGLVQVYNGTVAADQETPPDMGTSLAEHDAKLIDFNRILGWFHSWPSYPPLCLISSPRFRPLS